MLLLAALAFAVCAHLRPCCDVILKGERINCGASPCAIRQAEAAAEAAAEEILPGEAQLPDYRLLYRLSFRRAKDSAPELSDGLLRSTEGVLAGYGIYVRGQSLGTVESVEELDAGLDRYIRNTLPGWAVSGRIDTPVSVKPRYSRQSRAVSVEDMIMLITGMSPVMYTDGMGKISPV